MAESLDLEQNKTQKTNDFLADDFEDFCQNFNFLDTKSCCYCNGFYGPNCNQPLCVSCHKFVFATRKRKRLRHGVDRMAYKYYRYGYGLSSFIVQPIRSSPSLSSSSSSSPPSSSSSSSAPSSSRTYLQLKDLKTFFGEIVQSGGGGDNNNDTNKKSENEIEKCSRTLEVKCETHISVLPVEMLLKIFSHLDDITLLDVSKVSTQWKEILDTQHEMWKKFTEKRWPLLQRKTEPTSWLKMYTALESSCCCRTCANDMMQKSENSIVQTSMRRRAERDRMARFEVSGIRAIPLDGKLIRWQASIAGPADSPYEGGTFYLYIYMPVNYPFEPPVIKFLTKIIHPNVSRHGDIGLDIITWNYCLSLTINPMLLSIQSLLCDPYTKVCMEPKLGRLYEQDRRRFDALARHWTKKYAMMNEISFGN